MLGFGYYVKLFYTPPVMDNLRVRWHTPSIVLSHDNQTLILLRGFRS
jgi:hypothetical protein